MDSGRLRLGEPLARHTSWRIGGPAERFYLAAGEEDLRFFLQHFALGPITWLGLGSNVLVRDGGIRGSVICLAHGLDALMLHGPTEILAEAGVSAVKLAHFAARAGLAGCEFLAGIPGTLGGCLAMNAGAQGMETWELVNWVEVLQPDGTVERLGKEQFQVGYRSVQGQGQGCFLRASLRLAASDKEQVFARLRQWQARRAQTQPLEWPSCGSVFRNPPGDFAARLIEAGGLKGSRKGDAELSTKHANFIVNRGAARAQDVEELVTRVQETVAGRFGVHLEPEMRVLGEAEDD
ncbi:MAG: UDP-N-acetylmuramate dehydrogenase [Acidithiobacillus sp.]|nr:UDP-N-acetylmuramate dehydrogenase [Acidithiobacillus sp.]